MDKVRIAKSTLKHAKVTKDKALISKTHSLVTTAMRQAHKVTAKVGKASKGLMAATERLQKLGAKEAKKLSGLYKEKIRRVVVHAKHLKTRARRVLKAHKAQEKKARKASKVALAQASAAVSASEKAHNKMDFDLGKARVLDHKAVKIEKLAEPLEEAIETEQKKTSAAKNLLKLAHQSNSAPAIAMAAKKLKKQ